MRVIGWLLQGGLVPPLLILCGIFFVFYLRGLPLRRPIAMLASLGRQSSGTQSPFRSVTLALAGTLGVGNIVGVANAIAVGGAGAILWMWVSALAAMILKYAEIVLAVRHRRTDSLGRHHGGAVFYLRDGLTRRGLPRAGRLLGLFFGLLMLFNAVTLGNMLQVHAVASAAEGVLGVAPAVCGLLLLALTLPFLRKGISGVSALTEYLIPILSGGYLILSAAVLLLRREALPYAFGEILRSAWRPESAVGGLWGILTSSALRTGTMRGLLSNEAGCGPAPTAPAAADTDAPAAQGVWGILEVFVDTIVLCTLTALVILVSPHDPASFGANAILCTVQAYSSVLGPWSEIFFCIAVFAFGYATVLCWATYGVESLHAILPFRKGSRAFRLLYAAAIPIGSIAAPALLWRLSDFTLAALTTVNLTALFLMRKEIRHETDAFFLDKRSRK